MCISVNCGGIINDTEGYITALDEENDGMYDDSQYCIWKFAIEQYTSIHLNIYNFSVQQQNQSCLLDHLEVGVLFLKENSTSVYIIICYMTGENSVS